MLALSFIQPELLADAIEVDTAYLLVVDRDSYGMRPWLNKRGMAPFLAGERPSQGFKQQPDIVEVCLRRTRPNLANQLVAPTH